MTLTRKCSRCHDNKPTTEYYAQMKHCKTCHIETVRKLQQENPARYNAYRKEYAKKHPETIKAWNEASAKRNKSKAIEGLRRKLSERELLLKKEKINLELQRARALSLYWKKRLEAIQAETAMIDPSRNNNLEYRNGDNIPK